MKPYERVIKSLVAIEKPPFEIALNDKLFMLGSCFSKNLGKRFHLFRQPIYIDPFGTLYDPFAIKTCIEYIVQNKTISSDELVCDQSLYFHWAFSHLYLDRRAETLASKLNERIQEAHHALNEAKFLFITYGTALYYYHKETGMAVANCHKVSSSAFERRVPTVDEVSGAMDETIQLIKTFNPTIQIIFTISPVRHLRQGIYWSNLSKSLLKVGLHQMNACSKINYFPAYELVIDDLRDYRYFETDATHPNTLAVDYIWERLNKAYFSTALKEFHQEYAKLQTMLTHEIRFPDHPKNAAFKQAIQQKLERLVTKYPEIDFGQEYRQLKAQFD